MRTAILMAFACVLTASDARAQEPAAEASEPEKRKEWETDRDSFTPSVMTPGRSTWILESAYSFVDNRRKGDAQSYPEMLLRYGMTERLEARLGWNYELGSAAGGVSTGSGSTEDFAGHSPETTISYGIKWGITEQDGWRPASAIILAGFTPTSGEPTATQLVATYIVGREFENKWRLDAAFRYATDSEHGDRFEEWAPSIVLKIPFAERWNTHVEYFSVISTNKERNFNVQYISPGLHCLIRENCEAGVRVGWGLNDQSARFFVNAGLGLRF